MQQPIMISPAQDYEYGYGRGNKRSVWTLLDDRNQTLNYVVYLVCIIFNLIKFVIFF